jgi:hypothetical protein
VAYRKTKSWWKRGESDFAALLALEAKAQAEAGATDDPGRGGSF